MCSNVGEKGTRHVGIVYYVTFGLAILMLFTSKVGTLPLSNFYPFNASSGDTRTADTDDGGSGAITIRTQFPFFNRSYDKIFVNNNGIISFLAELTKYRPIDFPLDSNTSVIAPFWADVDVSVGGYVWFRQTTDKNTLETATNEIRTYFPALRKFRATWAFIATWDNVGFYGAVGEGKNKRNTFQAVLITDSLLSFVIFNYHKIQWTTGSNSGGETTTGLSGNPAQAGFNAGDREHYQEIPGARKDAVLNLTLTSNVDVPGKWVFRVDSATIQGSCSKSGSGSLAIIPSSGVVLGGEKIRLYGPCFYKEDRLVARFDELNVTFPCLYASKDHAECITPTVFRTGPQTLSLSIDKAGWNYTGTFRTVNIAQYEPSVTRLNPKKWLVNQTVRITWNRNFIPSNTSTVELLEYKEVNGTPSLRQVLNITDVDLTSSKQFAFKLQNISTAGIIRVTSQQNNINGSAVSIWSDVFPARWNKEVTSAGWCEAWKTEEDKRVNLTQREPCPCTRSQADGDTGRYQPDPLCNKRSKVASVQNCLYRGGATDCIMLNYQGSSEGSQLCCYGEDGELLHARDGDGGGTLGRYHYRSQSDDAVAFFSYFNEDVLPYLHCCQYSNKRKLCLDFLKLRPAVTCDGYLPPAAAQAAGDPHLVTLDGKNYTFNGEGDFVLMEDVNKTVAVQVRAARAKDIEGNLQNATLFTAVAMQVRNKSDVLEVRLDKEDIVRFLVKGRPRDLSSPTSELNGLTVMRKNTGNSTVEVTVVMGTSGISVLIQATSDLLNIMVTVGSTQLTGNLRGLLGNYNGNRSDDLVSRNGTLLTNASMKEIHYNFGMTWEVTEAENIMTPAVPIPSAVDETEKPFEPIIVDIAQGELRNGTSEVCGENIQCIFDYQVTGNEEIAKSTKDFSKRYEDTVNDIKPVVRCPYLDPPDNGNRSLSGLSKGSIARFVCNDGYVLNGPSILMCQPNGKWNGTVPSCGKPLNQGDDSAVYYYYVGGGVGGGIVIIIIIIAIFTCRCPRRKKKKSPRREPKSEDEIELPTIFLDPSPHIPTTTTVFKNELFLQSLRKLADSGSFRIPRPTYVDPNIYEEFFF